ncbi:MAG: hypothetical protein AB1439_06080 [candidate division FCPU426 bacterium]
MSQAILDILQSARKPKEKTEILTQALGRKKISAKEFMVFFKTARDQDQGSCADVMKHLSAEHPELLGPFIPDLIPCVTSRVNRVKWGVPEALGNLAEKYPEQVAKAIPNLLINAQDPSTVVRWCAAYALAALLRHHPKARKTLEGKIKGIIIREKNNGVRKVYEKALK